MALDEQQIQQIGKAFLEMASYPYTPEQEEFINNFLRSFAEQYDENEARKRFNDKPLVIEALKTLNQHHAQIQQDEAMFNEFKNEVDHLLVIINEPDGGIRI